MEILTEKDKLIIKLEGWEIVWSLKSRIEVPKSAIDSIEEIAESPKKNFALPFIKFPGSVIPGVLMAGNFIKFGERDFWYLRVKHPGVLDIKTKPGSFIYDRILVSCGDKDVQSAISWWSDK